MGTTLYDLTADPRETTDRSAANPSVTRALEGRISEWMDSASLQFEAVRLSEDELSPEAVEQLRSLGYMQ